MAMFSVVVVFEDVMVSAFDFPRLFLYLHFKQAHPMLTYGLLLAQIAIFNKNKFQEYAGIRNVNCQIFKVK